MAEKALCFISYDKKIAMLDKADRVRLLIRKYLARDLSLEEKVEFDIWLSASEENKKLLESFTDNTLFDKMLKEYFENARAAESLKMPDIVENRRRR